MPTFAAENPAGQLPEDPEQGPADPNPVPPIPGLTSDPSQDRSLPIPAWSQPYIRTNGRKRPSEWGYPDYILEGARRYPGLSPGPWMPQMGDMRGLINSTGMFFAQNGSLPNQLLAGQMLAFGDRWAKDVAAGMTARANLNLKEYQLRQYQLAEQNEKELRKFAETHAAYKDNPAKLTQAWLELSYEFDDPILRDAIQTSGLQRAEEVLNERHNTNLDQQKIIHQRLENDKLQLELQAQKDFEERYREVSDPNPKPTTSRQEAQAAENPTPDMANDPLGAPVHFAPAETATTTPATTQTPAATGAAPAAPAASAAPRPGMAAPAAAPPAVGAAPSAAPAAAAATTPAAAPIDAGTPAAPVSTDVAATAIRGTSTIGPAPSPTLVRAGRFGSQRELDDWSWEYLKRGNSGLPPRPIGSRKEMQDEYTIQTTAIIKRATGPGGIQQWLDTMLRSTQQQPTQNERASVANADRQLDILARAGQEGLASQLRQIIHGNSRLPQAGFGAVARFPQQVRDLVGRLDPTYSEGRYVENLRTRQAFSGIGQQALRIGAFMLAIKHAGTVNQLSAGIKNTDIPIYNRITNTFQAQTGNPRATSLALAMQLYSTEIARSFRGSATTLSEIEHIKQGFNPNMSPAQMQNSVRTLLEMANGQLTTLTNIYNQGTMGNKKPEDWIGDPKDIAQYRLLMAVPLDPAAAARAREIGGTTYDSTLPQEALELNQFLRENPNDASAAGVRSKLISLGWLARDLDR